MKKYLVFLFCIVVYSLFSQENISLDGYVEAGVEEKTITAINRFEDVVLTVNDGQSFFIGAELGLTFFDCVFFGGNVSTYHETGVSINTFLSSYQIDCGYRFSIYAKSLEASLNGIYSIPNYYLGIDRREAIKSESVSMSLKYRF